ncbi:unnamed protein product, partial [marine sediment metagenome]
SDVLKLKAGRGFQLVDDELARQVLSQFLPISELEEAERPLSLHEELKQKLIEIGKLQSYIAEPEYPFDIGKLDVVWRRIERSVPTYVFEIQVGGDLYHALAKLKHAFDLWNSHLFLIASQADHEKGRKLLSGSFHEIKNQIRFVELDEVGELYKRKILRLLRFARNDKYKNILYLPQQYLYFLPEPQGQGSLRPTFLPATTAAFLRGGSLVMPTW